jgi:ABC-type Fe3+ transport system substrate-binding protein
VLPVALGGVLVSANASLLGIGDCSGSLPVSIAATPESVEVLQDATLALEQSGAEADGVCVDYKVRTAAPNAVSRSLDARAADSPDLWVPDSAAWLQRIDGFGGEPAVVAHSLGRSPVVVAGRGLRQPRSWRAVLSRGDVTFVDPLRSSAPAAALLALRAEQDSLRGSASGVDSVMVPLAQRLGGDRDAPRDLTDLVLDPGGAAILSEQQLLDLRAHGLGRDLDVRVPKTGTMVMDYPLVALTKDTARVEAAGQLADYLQSPAGVKLLQVAGFRSADLEPLPFDRGVGELHLLPSPRAEVVATMLRHWSVLTVPSRILGVFDVSGSMDARAGGTTRVSLASKASAAALDIFPDQARIGMWAFSVGLNGRDRDHRELVPIRRLDSRAGGKSQRRLLERALADLPGLTYGGTGLYDTTLAAVRAVRSDYDENAVNTVVLMTDGRNEDSDSVSLPRLLRTLGRERDPSRPVPVIAIGIGPDADAQALRRIVAATGGRSYVARNPADISKVFKDALLRR